MWTKAISKRNFLVILVYVVIMVCYFAFIDPIDDYISRPNIKHLPSLINNLSSTDSKTYREAADRIGDYGERATSAIPYLINELKYEDKRIFTCNALAAIGKVALPDLIYALDSDDRDTRSGAAYAISEMGPIAKDAVPLLIQRLTDEPDWQVKAWIIYGLGEIGYASFPALLVLKEIADDPETGSDPDAKKAIDNIQRSYKDHKNYSQRFR